MPIKEIKKYAELRSYGESTMQERMTMLIKHKKNLKDKIEDFNEHLDKLDDKIMYYEKEINVYIKNIQNK